MSISFIFTTAEMIYEQISGKKDANEWYKTLVPELHEALRNDIPMSDPQLKRLIEKIIGLAPIGAKRLNFRERYMKNRESMLRLPKDPNDIMFGYWW
ncbi:hypothetical protein [Salinivibrio proteolyticus]|uniref:PH domain-containing protein n=1 Tax=Salinivibrio proteolyticus TaxID=334715 RepID=A0ABY7L9E0_9GAMM|nr:hypothetical protein [Salinivibrio proteolyticus]WBA13862.1 hypothetical protein N7E60_08980 [Salinivibrio proteolyticus]